MSEPTVSCNVSNCPTCESPGKHLHPAVQHEGEVQICRDPESPRTCGREYATGVVVERAILKGVYDKGTIVTRWLLDAERLVLANREEANDE